MTNQNSVPNYKAMLHVICPIMIVYSIYTQQPHLIPEDLICRSRGRAVILRHHIVAVDCLGDRARFLCRYDFHHVMTAFRYPDAGRDVCTAIYDTYPPAPCKLVEGSAAETGGIVR